MDYLREIVAFERWTETNHLPASSQLLWYKLMSLCNRAGWPEWVTVDNLRLMAMTGSGSKNTFLLSRDRLVEAGLLEIRRGKKGSPNRYRILSLCEKGSNFEPNPEPQAELYPEPYSEPQAEPQTGPIYKQKQKRKQRDLSINDDRFDKFWEAYPRKVGKQNAKKAFDKLRVDDRLLHTMLGAIAVAKRSVGWRDMQYIPHPATWLNGRRWEDEEEIPAMKRPVGLEAMLGDTEDV